MSLHSDINTLSNGQSFGIYFKTKDGSDLSPALNEAYMEMTAVPTNSSAEAAFFEALMDLYENNDIPDLGDDVDAIIFESTSGEDIAAYLTQARADNLDNLADKAGLEISIKVY